jgi:hypothetical protein
MKAETAICISRFVNALQQTCLTAHQIIKIVRMAFQC